MAEVRFPYGKGYFEENISDERLVSVLTSRLDELPREKSGQELVREAMLHPIGTPRLSEMAKGKKKVVLIASDHTRPVPSRDIVPEMLREIREGNPDAEITILIATGCHRETSAEELKAKFGEDIVNTERIIVHDCDDKENLAYLGNLPSGGELWINKLAADADLLVSEGFVEPHFFAGFSGGRKSVLPGIASRRTVLYNHNSSFIDNPNAVSGVLKNNPVHEDMRYAARAAHLAYIVNVVLDSEKNIVHAVAGGAELAHDKACAFLSEHSGAKVTAEAPDIVITTNGGYPLDQNIYQAVKGMSTAARFVREKGVIIMLSESSDGHGGESFYRTFRDEKDLSKMLRGFMATPPEETIVDQWQSQIFAKVLSRARVVFVSEAEDSIVREMHMIPAHSVSEALEIADRLLEEQGIPCGKGKILAIPDGVSLIPMVTDEGGSFSNFCGPVSPKADTASVPADIGLSTSPVGMDAALLPADAKQSTLRKAVLIPDSFKGTLSSIEICNILSEQIHAHFPNCQTVSIPVADGGEGSVDAFLSSLGGEKVELEVSGPFFEKMQGFYGLVSNKAETVEGFDGEKPHGLPSEAECVSMVEQSHGLQSEDVKCAANKGQNSPTAIIEMSACAGLPLVGEHKNPEKTTTYGVGELMLGAARKGTKRIIVGLGGSATNDGACGAAAACGIRFIGNDGKAFIPTGGTLSEIERIDASGLDPLLKNVEITCMCDIDNPMYGKDGAAYIFATQKGADSEMVERLDLGLRHLSELVKRDLGQDVSALPGGGAAGAMGAGMKAFFGAELKMGIDTVLDLTGFDELIKDADLIITGEGKLDSQSLRGKVVLGVGRRAKKQGKSALAIVGGADRDIDSVYENGILAVVTTNRLPEPLSESAPHAAENLAFAIDNILRLLKFGQTQ